MRHCPLALAAFVALALPVTTHASSGGSKAQRAAARSQELAAIVERVEQGLVPAVVVGGQPLPALGIADEMRARHVPGLSVVVIRNYQIDWARSYGVTRADDPQAPAVTPDTRFEIASISKTITAVAALRMVQDGTLALDAPVNGALKSWHLPENAYTRATPVTLRRLLNHTAGINVHNGPEGCYPRGKSPKLLQILDGAPPSATAPVTVHWPVGEAAHYSSNGFAVIQQLMVDQAGPRAKTHADLFAQILQREVFGPVGMRDSGLQPPLSPRQGKHRFAWPHDASGKTVPEGPLVCPSAAGGVWSTAPDIARFVIALQKAAQGRGPLLSKQSAAAMLTRGLENWGLGVGIGGQAGNPYFSYAGTNVGYQSLMLGYPATGDGAVVLTNGDGGNVLAMEILRAVSREYAWPDVKPVTRTPAALDAAALQRFTGRYLSENGLGPFSIRLEDGKRDNSQAGSQLVADTLSGPLRLWPLDDHRLFGADRDLVFSFDFGAADNADAGSIAFGTSFTDGFKRMPAKAAD